MARRGRGAPRTRVESAGGCVDEGDAPVVQAGALELGVLEGESKGSDEVQRDARRRARSRDGARVPGICGVTRTTARSRRWFSSATSMARRVAPGRRPRRRRRGASEAREVARRAKPSRGTRAPPGGARDRASATASPSEVREASAPPTPRDTLGARRPRVGRTFRSRAAVSNDARLRSVVLTVEARRDPRARTPATDRRDEARLRCSTRRCARRTSSRRSGACPTRAGDPARPPVPSARALAGHARARSERFRPADVATWTPSLPQHGRDQHRRPRAELQASLVDNVRPSSPAPPRAAPRSAPTARERPHF